MISSIIQIIIENKNFLEKSLEVAAKKLHQNYLTSGGKFHNGKTK